MLIGTKIAEQMAASNCLAKHDQFLGLEADLSLLHIFCGALKAVVGQWTLWNGLWYVMMYLNFDGTIYIALANRNPIHARI